MILYGSPISPFVRKVLVFAAEKGIELELVPVGIGDPNPDFNACSPFRKMPALRDGDFSISDSTAIVTYLDTKQPEHSLIPADAQARIIEEVRKAGASDELKSIWNGQGAEFPAMNQQQFAAFINAEIKRWAVVVKASGAKLD